MEIKMTDLAIVVAMATLKNEISGQKDGEEKYVGVRVKVVGEGCDGFTYDMNFEVQSAIIQGRDIEFEFEFGKFAENEKLKIIVDRFSMQYLDGMEIDFIYNWPKDSGFKFNNPNIKSKCGCGRSFSL